jgi:hypothetical protein
MPESQVCKFIVNNMFTLILHMVLPVILKYYLINSDACEYKLLITCEIDSQTLLLRNLIK